MSEWSVGMTPEQVAVAEGAQRDLGSLFYPLSDVAKALPEAAKKRESGFFAWVKSATDATLGKVANVVTSVTSAANKAVFGGPAGRAIGELESLPIVGPVIKVVAETDKAVGSTLIKVAGGQAAGLLNFPGTVAGLAIEARNGPVSLQEVNEKLSSWSPILHGAVSTFQGSSLGKSVANWPFKDVNDSSIGKFASDTAIIAAEGAVATGLVLGGYELGSLAIAAGIPSTLAGVAGAVGLGSYLTNRASRNIANKDIEHEDKIAADQAAAALAAAALLASQQGKNTVESNIIPVATGGGGGGGSSGTINLKGAKKKKKKVVLNTPSGKEKSRRASVTSLRGAPTQG